VNQPQHMMVLERTHHPGADEWYCPTCGRRLIILAGPSFKKTILQVGDEFAIHSGGKVPVQINALQNSSADHMRSTEEHGLSIEDLYLAPWITWMEQVNFDRLWDDEA
jgi:hypothetical protein